jgi:hypothetical protein
MFGRDEEDRTAADDDVVRLYGALVDAVQATRPGSFAAPVTVAEIYQDLVPYRAVKANLGFAMNADYEHALLRLLAGVGECARLEPVEAAAELRDELESPNPNVGIFRKFAGCDVWIAPPDMPTVRRRAEPDPDERWAPPEQAPSAASVRGRDAHSHDAGPPAHADGAHDADQAADRDTDRHTDRRTDRDSAGAGAIVGDDGGDGRPATAASDEAHEEVQVATTAAAEVDASGYDDAADDDEEPEYELVPVRRAPVTASGGAAGAGTRAGGNAQCAFCEATLPVRAHVRFCPYCGNDQQQHPCGSCGEPLEPDWRFCVACGASAAPA